MQLNAQTACTLLREWDNIVILAHQQPDGDTLGSSFALLYALEQLQKTARVECSDGFPEHYGFLYEGYEPRAFEEAFVVAVDIADAQLLGNLRGRYEGRINLCIDHHKSNRLLAEHALISAEAPATAQIVYDLLRCMGVQIDKKIATAIYTGLTTDTGCFRFPNVTATTHRVAAEMIECGAEHAKINKLMFETKTRGRLEVDRAMMNSLEYYFGGRCAVVNVPDEIPRKYNVTEEEMDGISAFPRMIEGVSAGVTLRERENGVYRVSLRTGDGVDASLICTGLGGGGHKNAAGCTLRGTLEEVRGRVLAEVQKELERAKA